MPTLELELGDERLEEAGRRAYFERQLGRLQQWQTKIANLKATEPSDSIQQAQIALDLKTCEAEIARITREVELAQSGQLNPETRKPYTPGDARVYFKRPSKTLNRNKALP